MDPIITAGNADRRPNPHDLQKSADAREGEGNGIGGMSGMSTSAAVVLQNGDVLDKGKGREKGRMDVFVRPRVESRSPSFELIEETPRTFVKPTQTNGHTNVNSSSSTSRIASSNAGPLVTAMSPPNGASPPVQPSPARTTAPLHTASHSQIEPTAAPTTASTQQPTTQQPHTITHHPRPLPQKIRLSTARQPVIYNLSARKRNPANVLGPNHPVRQVVETGAGILEPGVVPLGHSQTQGERGASREERSVPVSKSVPVSRNGVRAFPAREKEAVRNGNGNANANGSVREETRNGEGSSFRKERPIQRRPASPSPPVRTKQIRRQREESDFEDEAEVRKKHARRQREESDSESAEVRTKHPRRQRQREESDFSDSAERVKGKEPRRRVEMRPTASRDVSRRRVRVEEQEEEASSVRPRKETSRRIDPTISVSPPPRTTQSRRIAEEVSTTQQPRPKAKPRRPDPPPRSESPPPRPVQSQSRRPAPIPKNRKAPPEVQQETSQRRARPVIERSPSVDQVPDYTELSPPPSRILVASSTATAREPGRPKGNFTAYLNRAKLKKGGGMAAPAAHRAVVQGPPAGVNKWRRIAQKVETDPESEEEDGEELESEDGYPLRMESEDDAPLQLVEDAPLQMEAEDVPLQLDEDVVMDSGNEESEEEPQPKRQQKRQEVATQRRAEPQPRKEKPRTAGKVHAGRVKVKNVVPPPSERSTDSRPASQRLPPPPVSSPPFQTPPPSPPPRSRTQSARAAVKRVQPSLKALRLAEKQAEIVKLIDEHDTVLREMFHLQSFKTMIVGFDPAEAKKETSKVWQAYQAPSDLVSKFITSNPYAEYGVAEDAGLSRRTTRRKLEKQVNDLPLEVLLGIPPELRIVKEEPEDDAVDRAEMDADEVSAEGRRERRAGKQKEVVAENVAPLRSNRSMTAGSSKRKSAPITVESLPPTPIVESFTPVPDPRPPTPIVESFIPHIDAEPLPPTPLVEPSLPPSDPLPTRAPTPPAADLPPAKKRRIASPSDGMDNVQLNTGFFEDLTGIDADRPAEIARVQRKTPRLKEHSRLKETPRLVETSRLKETPRLPKTPRPADVVVRQETAHPALTQPVRKSARRQHVNANPAPAPPPRYTCPEQFPAHRRPAGPAAHVIFAEPKLTNFPNSRDVPSTFPSDLLTSFVMLEADGELVSEEDLRRTAEHRVEVKRKVAALRELGRTTTGQTPTKGNSSVASRSQGPRLHHALHLDDALRRRAHLLREEKQKTSQLKKIVKAVNAYWSGIASLEERRIKEEERKLKALAREVAKAVRRKWKLAVNVVRSKKQAEIKAEQERVGREHMRKILERSENMIKNRGRRKRIKDKPKREISPTSTPSRQARFSSQQSVRFDNPEVGGGERDHDTEDEGAADFDAEEEEAAKAHELTQSSSHRLDSGDRLSRQQTSSSEDCLFVDVPSMSDTERSTYTMSSYSESIVASRNLPKTTVPELHPVDSDQTPSAIPSPTPPPSLPLPMDAEQDHHISVVDSPLPPDQQAIQFAFRIAAEDEAEDRKFDEEMLAHHDQAADSDDEDAGLLQDAELPIEELLARYNYKLDEAPYAFGVRGSDTESSADSDDEEDRLNIDESVAAASESSLESDLESKSESDTEQPIGLPFLLRADLRPYQRTGLTWLARLYREKTNAILADEMGLGKTLQTIALLAHLACDQQEWGPHLIIVPTSVILNWEMEFKKFLPGFKVLTYYGSQQERKERRKGWFSPHAFQVCITSYQIAIADQAIFRRRQWQYLILDEAHNIKNFRSQRWQTLLGFKSERRLLLTGTPLQNNLMELWSLMYFLMPAGLSGAYDGGEFADHKEFSDWFSNPMDKAVESGDGISAEARETVNRLHVILRPFILRRLKAEVEKQLPAKVEHTVYCNLSKRQQYLYDEFMSRSSTRHSLVNGGYLGIANCLMQLRKVCNHPDLFEVRPIATSFAMQQSVVSSFRGTFAAFDGIRIDATERLHLKEFDYYHGPPTRTAAEAISRLDATFELPGGETTAHREIPPKDTRTLQGWKNYQAYQQDLAIGARWKRIRDCNRQKCNIRPAIDDDTLRAVRVSGHQFIPHVNLLSRLVVSNTERLQRARPLMQQFAVIPPKATALEPTIVFSDRMQQRLRSRDFHAATDILHSAAVKLQIAFPDKTLLQYDCGKLQKLAEMLKTLQAGGHRVLIFTQMTKMLDILETFLSHAGYRYSRLDGSTKIEDRLLITERFNNNPRIFAFIASTRSGGVGINLTGADTVIFYDNEFNPAMDKQAMDRAHRIGQTREVHIYRLVTRHTVEENMLKRANQKRLLDDVVMQEGNFTTDYLTSNASKGKHDLRDMLGEDVFQSLATDGSQPILDTTDVRSRATSVGTADEREMQNALEQVQDTEDIEAGREAAKEIELEDTDFATDFVVDGREPTGDPLDPASERSASAIAVAQLQHSGDGEQSGAVDTMQDQDAADAGLNEGEEAGAVENWMLRVVEEDWDFFDS